MTTTIPTNEAFRAALLDQLRARIEHQHPRNAKGKLPKAANTATLEFICGAAAAIVALGLDESHGLTGLAFLAAVRDAESIINKP